MLSPRLNRKLELELGPVAPWHTTVTVHSVETNHGRSSSLPHDHLFEVAADWVGPPAVGFPPSPRPVSSRDVVIVETLEHAREIAKRALDLFAKGGDQAPDLRDLIQRNSVAFAPRGRGAADT